MKRDEGQMKEPAKNSIMYYQKDNGIEYVCCRNTTRCYPVHTHANHMTLGYLLSGGIRMVYDMGERLYHAGDCYCIMPDMPHALEPMNDSGYSLISICLPVHGQIGKLEDKYIDFIKLKQLILKTPENIFLIEDMARYIGISPYHMIRQFKTACGLTPHQFQIQCRVRKAQKLLEEGKSVTEAAYDAGFYDQSHFDRCFQRIVRLTPKEYKQSVKRLP